ncbi:Coiled-coil domain-containing protein 77 [Fasciolopsis buskii]|uniref:Coiled-coil domain-containing protein 77 n=1 Tax=Fasciolopsis buskii TaxID=27845 RepID=A0A8E0SAL1_9TREM|nr:Coiled-coil domain-containing protein 77 [Fasciolopsis buski]
MVSYFYKKSRRKLVQGAGNKVIHGSTGRNSPEGAQNQAVADQSFGQGREDLVDSCLSQLSDPSNELLAYYRRKVETLTGDHEHVQRRLDQIADAIGTQETLTWEIRQREAEIAELQRALSDMQVYLFQEREHVLRMYAENDRLKIRELDDRRKIQHLLQLSGLGPAEVTYFLRDSNKSTSQTKNVTDELSHQVAETDSVRDNVDTDGGKANCLSGLVVPPLVPTAPVQVVLELTASGKIIRRPGISAPNSSHTGDYEDRETSATRHTVSRSEHEAALREIEMAKASLRSLRTQLAEQTRTAREEIDALMDDRTAMQEEMDKLRKRHEDRTRQSAEQLKRCQDLLYESTKEFLAQRNQFRQAEKLWIAEKDKLLSQLEVRRVALASLPTAPKMASQSNSSHLAVQSVLPENNTILESKTWSQVINRLSDKKQEQMAQTIANLENQLDQQQKLSDMYREQVIQLEEELVKCREEGLVSKDALKQHTDKLNQRLQTVNNRYRDLERRRQLEMEGYRTDISALRKKLREVEKQLLKLTLGLTDGLDNRCGLENVDVAILEQVEASATRSMHLMNQLKSLKLKMYALEDELRRV